MQSQVEKKNLNLKPISAACKKLLQARDAERVAMKERNAAIVKWWIASVVPKSGASEAITAALREEGWTEEDISRVGVSVASSVSILNIVKAYPRRA